MSIQGLARKVVIASAATGLVAVLAPAASAVSASPADRTCVNNISTGEQTCYATPRQALSVVTGGLISADRPYAYTAVDDEKELTAELARIYGDGAQLDEDGAKKVQVRPASLAVTPMSTTVIMMYWEHANKKGANFVEQTNDKYACYNNNTMNDVYWRNHMESGWNDRMSSFKTFSNCAARVYEDANRTGAMLGGMDVDHMGALNDKVSSFGLW